MDKNNVKLKQKKKRNLVKNNVKSLPKKKWKKKMDEKKTKTENTENFNPLYNR